MRKILGANTDISEMTRVHRRPDRIGLARHVRFDERARGRSRLELTFRSRQKAMGAAARVRALNAVKHTSNNRHGRYAAPSDARIQFAYVMHSLRHVLSPLFLPFFTLFRGRVKWRSVFPRSRLRRSRVIAEIAEIRR